jgi:hypothetical protein
MAKIELSIGQHQCLKRWIVQETIDWRFAINGRPRKAQTALFNKFSAMNHELRRFY